MKVTYVLCTSILFCGVFIAEAQNLFDWKSILLDMIKQKIQAGVNKAINKIVLQIKNGINQLIGNTEKNMSKYFFDMDVELATLGSQIKEEVQNGLEPSDALKIQSQMARGVGGVTVAIYGDLYKIFYENGRKYSCPGDIIDDGPKNPAKCTEKFKKLSPEQKICTANKYARKQNFFCFNPNTAITCINDSCKCHEGPGFTLSALKKKCGNTYASNKYVKFTYFPIASNKYHIQLPNPNKHVSCEEPESNLKCTWHSDGLLD